MTTNKNNNKKNKPDMEKENKVEIKENNESSISEFVKRPLATDKEIEKFEVVLEDEVRQEEREDEIDESLTEIYQDEAGHKVDVKKLDIIRKRGLAFWLLNFVLLAAILAGAGYGLYYYIFHGGSDATAIKLTIESEEKVLAGEEFFYTIKLENASRAMIKDIRVEVSYPDNFVFLDSVPVGEEYSFQEEDKAVIKNRNHVWLFPNLDVRASEVIKIKGKIIDLKETENIILAKTTYVPENFSSEFRKEASLAIKVKDIGFETDFEYVSAVLVGQENEVSISIKAEAENYINEFRIKVEPKENLELISLSALATEDEESKMIIEQVKTNIWQIANVPENLERLALKYKYKEKLNDSEELFISFEQSEGDRETLTFLEEKISQEVMKNDLNLTLIINGSKNDQGIDFGETLNYSIVYANKGETDMKDVVIMAVLESDFLDWGTLNDDQEGQPKGNTISWSKEEIAGLEELAQEDEGVIDFSIKLKEFSEQDLGKDFQAKSYVQFSIGNIDEITSGGDEEVDNRSNTIINKINSDLNLKEEVRYFSEDNIPVGNGPLPPKVGETTSFKVYWVLTNNLHELEEAQVEVKLPDYISWDNKNRTSVGSIRYNQNEHKVVWKIGRLPLSVYRADAEFNISITPGAEDKNRIMVLLLGSDILAVDNETGEELSRSTVAKTTKLEDDEIASLSSDGLVE